MLRLLVSSLARQQNSKSIYVAPLENQRKILETHYGFHRTPNIYFPCPIILGSDAITRGANVSFLVKEAIPENLQTPKMLPSAAELKQLRSETRANLLLRYPSEYAAQLAEAELRLLAETPTCLLTLPSDAPNTIPELNTTLFQQLLRTRFYDATLVETLRCLLLRVLQNNHTRRLLRATSAISETVFYCDLRTAERTFILKIPLHPQGRIVISREYLIGTLALNRLRNRIPNFSYIFGYFECLPPITEAENPNVITWCTSDDTQFPCSAYANVICGSTPYVIQEYIVSLMDTRAYVRSCSGEEFLQMYTQVLLALRLAWQEYDFTHYDLHPGNVVMRSIPDTERFYIRYPTPWGVRYLLTSRIATIIDYGSSHIRHRDINIGAPDQLDIGILPDRSFPLYDAYRLLIYCLRYIFEVGGPALDAAIAAFHIFNTSDSLKTIVDTYSDILPPTEALLNFSFDDVLNALLRNVELPFLHANPEPGIRILECDSVNPCQSVEQVVSSLRTLEIRGILDLVDMMSQPPAVVDTILTQTVILMQASAKELESRFQRISVVAPTQDKFIIHRYAEDVAASYDILFRVLLWNRAYYQLTRTSFDLTHAIQIVNMELARIRANIGGFYHPVHFSILATYLVRVASLPDLQE